MISRCIRVCGHSLFFLVVRVQNEGEISVNDRFRELTSNGEGVSHDGPLGLIEESHDFAYGISEGSIRWLNFSWWRASGRSERVSPLLTEIVDESSQVEPFLVRMLSPDFFGRLEGMHDVGHVNVGIRFVNEVVQLLESSHDRHPNLVELTPFLAFPLYELDALVGVHLQVSLKDSLLDGILLWKIRESVGTEHEV